MLGGGWPKLGEGAQIGDHGPGCVSVGHRQDVLPSVSGAGEPLLTVRTHVVVVRTLLGEGW